MAQKLPIEDFKQLVRNAPLISIDLVVRTQDGKVLLGRRSNEPAKGLFFVPGGRILKDETISAAFSRLVREELGIRQELSDGHGLGIHEHFYDTNAFGVQGFGTHYVVMAYELRLAVAIDLHALPNSQHSEYRWMQTEEAVTHAEVHENSKRYFRSATMRNETT